MIRPGDDTGAHGMTEARKRKAMKSTGPTKLRRIEDVRREKLEEIQPQFRKKLEELLKNNEDVFPDELPKGRPPARAVEHAIKLVEGAEPVNRPPYRFRPKEQAEMESQIKELLAQGFIRPSYSPYGAPVLFVPKKDGRWRMCVDYRALNKDTIKDKYLLPRIDDLLDRLGKARYFTKLDLASGYHQIGVKESDIHKTAFRTNRGHFEYIVMPFGLTNAPATFQRLMNKVFDKEWGVYVLVYLDDILVFSKDAESHFKHLETVLGRMKEAKLYGRLHKCEFMKEEVEYLGFKVSQEGIKPMEDKVQAVLD